MKKVAELSAMPRVRGMTVDFDGDPVLLVRDGSAIRAYAAKCPHAGAPLDQGAVCNDRIVCPWHKAEFRVSDGALVEPPALEGLRAYPVTVDGDDVLLGPANGCNTGHAIGDLDRHIFIVGAGAAGASAALALREFGFSGRITLAGRETRLPYDRTSLSKFVLSGDMKPQDVPPLRPDCFYIENKIERIETEVTSLDAKACHATCADGRTFDFDAALIATGAIPARPDIPGAALAGVHVLRTGEDAAGILADLPGAAHAVILGASFIGLEAACGLRARNIDVTVVAPEEVPFARQFGSEIGMAVRALHEEHGVHFRTGMRAVRLEGDAKVRSVILEDGTRLSAEIVLLGLGVRPATDFITGIACEPDGSLRVDAGMRVTPNIYAAGDIACFPRTGASRRARIEHWRVAQQQGRIAARNLAGGDATYAGVPFFWTYHYGKRFEYLGDAHTWDEIAADGDIRQHKFIAFLCDRGSVAAVVACGREYETALLAERMRQPLTVTAALELVQRAKQQAGPGAVAWNTARDRSLETVS
jgi:NADPH-dependent 2,4-dienoyl-CoA reductase/sulfur reductase-like enzyme/nitrite reductase/ring-hydroxylating ferredoxin subunit